MTDVIELRLARSADAESIAAMSRDLIEAGLGWSWTPSRIIRSISCPDTTVLVATERGQVVGFAIMHFSASQAHLTLLAVKPERRRTGVGRRLIRWLEQSALVAGTPFIYLEMRAGNRGALTFYEKLGYRKVAFLCGYYRGRESGIRMGRDLWASDHIGDVP
jgi:ribosomal-protein-alanine N-acetyltransferase